MLKKERPGRAIPVLLQEGLRPSPPNLRIAASTASAEVSSEIGMSGFSTAPHSDAAEAEV
jgi:hypothetical protein